MSDAFEPKYLLWSTEHQMWWKSEGWGYTDIRDQAGRFSREYAVSVVTKSADSGTIESAEIMVRDVEG